MNSPPQSDDLLDLLYGEVSPRKEAELRQAIDEDDELSEQWDELRQNHRDVQTQVPPPQEVPEPIRTSILEASVEHASSPDRRDPDDAPTTSDGLWTSFVDSGGLRAATALAVVGFSAVVVYMVYDAQTSHEPSATIEQSADQTIAQADQQEAESPAREETLDDLRIARQSAVDDATAAADDVKDTATGHTDDIAAVDELLAAEGMVEDQRPQAQADVGEDDSDDGPLALRGDAFEAAEPAESAPAPEPEPASPAQRGRSTAVGGSGVGPEPEAEDHVEADQEVGLDALGEADEAREQPKLDLDAADEDAADSALLDSEAAAQPADDSAATETASPAAGELLRRADRAHQQGDDDRARELIDELDEDELDEDELDDFHTLQETLDEDDS